MPRGPRDADPGTFHITAHSVWTGVLFRDDIDRMHFVTQLAKTTSDFGWTCVGFTLLTTHYHLLLVTADTSLSDGLKQLNLSHACRFNARHKLRGHVFGERFSSRRIEDEPYLVVAYRYVARNACEAGLCRAPADWPWGSYRALVVPSEPFSFVDVSRVLACFGPDRDDALAQLRRFVDSSW